MAVFFVWNMEVCLSVPVYLHGTKINDVHFILMGAKTHEKIGGFDIVMNIMTRVNILNT